MLLITFTYVTALMVVRMIGVMTSNVGQPVVSRATMEVALIQRNPVVTTGM